MTSHNSHSHNQELRKISCAELIKSLGSVDEPAHQVNVSPLTFPSGNLESKRPLYLLAVKALGMSVSNQFAGVPLEEGGLCRGIC
jgi:hypothetical protein